MDFDRTAFLTLVMTAGMSGAVACGGAEPSQPKAAESAPPSSTGAERNTPTEEERAPLATEPAPVDPVVEQPGPASE
jgi:hypothetical protein